MMGIELALRQARASRCRFRVGAVLASKNRVFAASPNKRRNSPVVDFRHSTFHAEEAVLRQVRDTAGREIYVARVNARAEPALARPCPRCLALLGRAGIGRAFYTIDAHTLGVAFPVAVGVDPPTDRVISLVPFADRRAVPVAAVA